MQGFVHALALHIRIDAQHMRIGDQRPWSHPQHHPAPRQVIEQHHAVGHM